MAASPDFHLHQVLLDTERAAYEQVYGRVQGGEM
jgi:hypothetical protein